MLRHRHYDRQTKQAIFLPEKAVRPAAEKHDADDGWHSVVTALP
jgi:hypothetical protein